MTKREFLDRLERCLAALDAGEKASTVEFYEEQIDDRIDDGMTEEQAVASLESPEDIAASILAMRAEVAEQQAAATAAQASPLGATAGAGQAAPVKRHRVLRGMGRAILGFLEVLVAIMLFPVACGLVAAVVVFYLGLWCIVAGFALACVGSAAASVLVAVSCIVDPPASQAVLMGTAGIAVGSLSLVVICGILAYFSGKLLVMIVVWIVRAIRNRVAERKATRMAAASVGATAGGAAAGANAGASAKDYPSMPMPPMPQTTPAQAAQPPRKKFPLWAKFCVVACILACTGGGLLFGAICIAGGPEELVRTAGRESRTTAQLDVDAEQIDRIDLTLDDLGASSTVWDGTSESEGFDFKTTFAVGISPDDQIHVIGSSTAGGLLFWGEWSHIDPIRDGSTLGFEETEERGTFMQNVLAMFNYTRTAYILIPAGWEGDIVGNVGNTAIDLGMMGGYYYGEPGLSIAGDIDVSAGQIDLYNVQAGDITLDATVAPAWMQTASGSYSPAGCVDLFRVDARGRIELASSVNAYLVRTQAADGIAIEGARRAYIGEGVDLAGLSADPDVKLVSDDGEPLEPEGANADENDASEEEADTSSADENGDDASSKDENTATTH